jgi:predicted transcriptional regulator
MVVVMSKAGIIELENQRAILGTRAVEFAAQLEKQEEKYEAEILRLKELIAAQVETIKELQAKAKESAEADSA